MAQGSGLGLEGLGLGWIGIGQCMGNNGFKGASDPISTLPDPHYNDLYPA